MPVQILSTKLSIPFVRSRVVIRPRLIQKLAQGMEGGFMLVSAPAGYGKSTLLSTWLSRVDTPSAWLSLDDRDNDLPRFLTYLVSALRVIDPSIKESFEPTTGLVTPEEAEGFLTSLINHFNQKKQPGCLVLDDYHVIQNQAIHQVMSFLVENRPILLRLVIATRADPPLPLARMRARWGVHELRMADMRFTTQEATDFLNHTMGIKASAEDVARITKRTEGWIAGLQMAALSMQNATNISEFITSISGNQHYIFDYLLEEILAKQTTEVQRFLLYTSTLEQFTAPLCDALFDGEQDHLTQPASTLIDELDHANLFIIPLDHKQQWYRYHALFAELLRGYLQKNDPQKIPVLHTRASIWLEAQGQISDAIRHSFAAHDWERAVRLISANIFALLEQSELNSVARQLESLTDADNPARPWLLVGRAWLTAYTGQISSVEPILHMAEAEFINLKSEEELQTLGGHIAAIRAYIYWIADQRDIASRAAQAALQWLPEDERLIRCQASTLLGLTLTDADNQTHAMEQALRYARQCDVSHVTIFAQACWAWLLTMRGRLREAYAACFEAIQAAQSKLPHQPLPTLSHVYTTISFILHEWNDIQGALTYAKEAVELARRWEQADALHFALDKYGDALFSSGNMEAAYDVHHQAWQVAHRTSTWFEQITIVQEVEWYLQLGNLDAAFQCLHQAGIEINQPAHVQINSFKTQIMSHAIIQVYLRQKEYQKALDLITAVHAQLSRRYIGYYLIPLYIWQALAHQGMKQNDQALKSIEQALVMAAPENYIHAFIQEGDILVPLLEKAKNEGIAVDYVDKLLASFMPAPRKQASDPSVSSTLVEALSEREMDVLKLLAQGCSDKKIAESLVIARETVHKHLKNIYGKLDVHSRTEAVAQAHALNLL